MAEPHLIAGRYEVREAIGSGARGQVYLAHDPLLDSLVAIKMLHHNGADEAVVRFQKEAIATGKLKHPRIAQTLDFGIADGVLYMVMEFVDGVSLEQLLESEECLPTERALPLFLDICEGLAHAHANGIFHRDLKPANVIVVKSEAGEFAKLVDFGIAKIQGDDLVVTDPQAIIGSPIYMSPEQCKGEVCDSRSDLYSFGCLMFETLSGNPPFLGDTAIDTINLKTTRAAPELSSVMDTSHLPPVLVQIIQKCLERDPQQRYQSVTEIEKALDEITLDRESGDSSQPVSTGSRTAKMPALYVVLTLVVILLISGYVAQQILTDGTAADSSKLKIINTGLESAEFYKQSTKFVDPKVEDKYDDDDVVRDDDTRSFGVQLQHDIPVENKGNQINCFVVDGKTPDRIRTTRMVHDEDFKQLVGKTYLRRLDIDHAGSLTGAGMKYIEKLPLKEIRVNNSMMKDVAMEHFCKIPTLEFLSVHDGINFTDQGLRNIGNLKKLRMLEITSANITDAGVEYVSQSSQLEWLMLSRTSQITDKCIPSIIRLSKLRTLTLSDTGVTADGIVALARGRKNLYELTISGLPWSDESMTALAEMPNLSLLSMENTKVNNQLLQHLTRLKALAILELEAKTLSPADIRVLQGLPNLTRLLLRNPVVSIEFLNSLATLKVKTLELNRAVGLYDATLYRLQNMPALEYLSISDCNDSDVTWKGVQEFKRRYSKRWKRNIEVGYDTLGIAE